MAEILGKDEIVIGLVGDPWRDKFHIIHVSRWALVPWAVIPEPFLNLKFTPRNINSDLGLDCSHKRLPCFLVQSGKSGRGEGSWEGTLCDSLVCSVSGGQGPREQRDRLMIESSAWLGSSGNSEQP